MLKFTFFKFTFTERDLIRKQNIEEKKAEMEALHLEKTRRARARVVSVLEDKERKLEEKRQALYKKMDKQQRRMDDFEQQKRDQALARLKQGQLREEQRSQSRLDSQLKEQRRITDILDKKMMHERHKFELDKKRRDEMEFRQEMLRLNRKRKQMNVDRLKRMENYKRLMLVEKVNEDAQRTRELELQKQKLIRDRQTNRIMVTRQKQGLVEMFEKIKLQRNWNQLNNLLTGGEDSDEEGGMDSGRMHSGRRTPAGKRNRDKGGMGAGGLSKSNSAATLKEFFSRMSASQSTASLNSAKKPTKGRRRR